MPNREPPVFGPSDPYPSYARGLERPKRSFASTLLVVMMTLCLSFLGLIGGFIVGDNYGRKNAQYDNPVLREYYAGKCYNYWESQFKQTLNASLEKSIVQRESHDQKLQDIAGKLQDLERAISEQIKPTPVLPALSVAPISPKPLAPLSVKPGPVQPPVKDVASGKRKDVAQRKL